jgi:hypothetical protein
MLSDDTCSSPPYEYVFAGGSPQTQDPLSQWTVVPIQSDIGYRRQGAALVAVDDTLWLLGGSKMFPGDPLQIHFTTNEIFRTQDGLTWERLPTPPWAPRLQFVAALLSSGNLYLMAGWSGQPTGNPVGERAHAGATSLPPPPLSSPTLHPRLTLAFCHPPPLLPLHTSCLAILPTPNRVFSCAVISPLE